MEEKEYKKLLMIAHEAFIKRAGEIDRPFMLKGSYVTRQYFKDPTIRVPADLDWIYLKKIENPRQARRVLNDWVTKITEIEFDDNVKFRSFTEDEFWRRIDYAMADDFPTVNTDITCWVDEKKIIFDLDISFNLPISAAPVSLAYQPLIGEPFLLRTTTPLSLQVSWKIHQTLVRPRFKDLFDVMHLVQHDDFNSDTLKESFKALLTECKADNIDLNKLAHFLSYDLEKLYPDNSFEPTWNYWRHGINNKSNVLVSYAKAERITNPDIIPELLKDFLIDFKKAMVQHGWKIDLISDIEIISTAKWKRNKLIKKGKPKKSQKTDTTKNSDPTPLDKFLRLFKSK